MIPSRLRALALIVVAAAGAAYALESLGDLAGVGQFESYTLDLRQQSTVESFQLGMGERESEIVLVFFDEFSVMDPVNGWPWLSPFPRSYLAEIVDSLVAAGARTIGLDVYLDRVYPPLNEIDGGDDLLHDAIERAGNVVLVTPVVATDSGPVSAPPHPYFGDVAAGVGTAEFPAAFETFRDGTLAVRSGNRLEPSFALAIYAQARGLDVDSILDDAMAVGQITLPGMPERVGRIPDDFFDDAESSSAIVPFRIRYLGPPSSPDASGLPGTFPAVRMRRAASSSFSRCSPFPPTRRRTSGTDAATAGRASRIRSTPL